MLAEKTNAKDFRNKLKEYLDSAVEKPVGITRGKDRFVLMNEDKYLDLQDELLSLQRNLLAVLGAQGKEGQKEEMSSEEYVDKLFSKSKSKRDSAERKGA